VVKIGDNKLYDKLKGMGKLLIPSFNRKLSWKFNEISSAFGRNLANFKNKL